jgi:hypothetical protein
MTTETKPTTITVAVIPSPAGSVTQSVIADLEAISTGMTGDLTPANVANIALDELTASQPPAVDSELMTAVNRIVAEFNQMADTYNATGIRPSMGDLRVAIERLAAAALRARE